MHLDSLQAYLQNEILAWLEAKQLESPTHKPIWGEGEIDITHISMRAFIKLTEDYNVSQEDLADFILKLQIKTVYFLGYRI
jgi:hypothetical protein